MMGRGLRSTAVLSCSTTKATFIAAAGLTMIGVALPDTLIAVAGFIKL